MRRWVKEICRRRLVPLGVAAAGVLAGGIVWNLVAPRPDPLVESFRQRGYPVTLAEMNAWYPAVPAAENEALVYTNAVAHLTNAAGMVTNFFARSWQPPLGRALSEQDQADLRRVLAANGELLRLLASAPTSGHSRYPLDLREGYTLALPHLAKTKQVVTLLAAEAVLHAGESDAEAATRSLLTAARVAESLGEEPIIISQTVRGRDWAILLAGLERALCLTSFTDAQLAALQAKAANAERPQALLRAWVGERLGADLFFHDPKMRESAFAGFASIIDFRVDLHGLWCCPSKRCWASFRMQRVTK